MKPLNPHGEELRKAVRWLCEQPQRDTVTIEEAGRRFDLSPLEVEFLRQMFREQKD